MSTILRDELVNRMEKSNENRYVLVKPLLDSGVISSLSDLFNLKVIGITQFIKDTGRRYSTMHDRLFKPENLTTSDLIKIGELLNISPQDVLNLALKDIAKKSPATKLPKSSS